MLLTFDDQYLLTAAGDGCLFTWKVFDKDGRGIKREREVGFAEEVLVTKIDLEEKVRMGLITGDVGITYETASKFQTLCSLAAPTTQLSLHILCPHLPLLRWHLICFHCTLAAHDHLMLCSTFNP